MKSVSPPIPPRSRIPDAELQLSPLHSAWTEVATRSFGNKIRVRVAVPVLVWTSLQFIAEDTESKGALYVAIYNFPKIDSTTPQSVLDKKFPVGTTLTFLEPYLRRFSDAAVGVRVDNPHEIVLS